MYKLLDYPLMDRFTLRMGVIHMLINEVCSKTNLTKKAIEYYVAQSLVSPSAAENGYREFSDKDVERLKVICTLRKLDVSTADIQRVLEDQNNTVLQTLSVRKELELQQDAAKQAILQKLCEGADYSEAAGDLKALEQGSTITDRLLEVFPGFFGRFIALHFARFLNEPIQTQEQQDAYDTVIAFLDNLPPMKISADLEDFLNESTEHTGVEEVTQMLDSTRNACQNPEKYIEENRDTLEMYMKYRQTDEYRDSPAGRLMSLMKELNQSNGYNDVFIPAMKRLSVSYAEYYQKLESANEVFLNQYPKMRKS
jgi:DNA-binding transcriptional MerR regulator